MRLQLRHWKRWKGNRGKEREADVLRSLVSTLLGAHLHSYHSLIVLEKKKSSLYNAQLAWHSARPWCPTEHKQFHRTSTSEKGHYVTVMDQG